MAGRRYNFMIQGKLHLHPSHLHPLKNNSLVSGKLVDIIYNRNLIHKALIQGKYRTGMKINDIVYGIIYNFRYVKTVLSALIFFITYFPSLLFSITRLWSLTRPFFYGQILFLCVLIKMFIIQY